MIFLEFKQGINKKIFQPILVKKRKNKFADKNMSIISSNCIGGTLAHDFGWQFLSPTVNMFILPKDFLLFCENLEECLKSPVIDDGIGYSGVSYPKGKIVIDKGEIVLHFLHYHSFQEAKEKWEQRARRIDFNRLLIVMTDQNDCSKKDIDRFNNLKYNKLFVTGKEEYKNISDNVLFVPPTKKEKKNNINSIDSCMHFMGISGKRRYEKKYDFEKFVNEVEFDA